MSIAAQRSSATGCASFRRAQRPDAGWLWVANALGTLCSVRIQGRIGGLDILCRACAIIRQMRNAAAAACADSYLPCWADMNARPARDEYKGNCSMPQTPRQTITPTPECRSPGRPALLPVTLAAATGAFLGFFLAWIAWSRNYVNHNVPLTAALDGELVRFRGRRAGQLAYYVAGPIRRGVPPLVLLHSINAAASSFEMKPLYDHYAQSRRVIALDFPGYGFSDRSDRVYRPALFRDAILDLIEQELNGASVDAVALSLGSEFLALAAQARPLRFRSLAFLSPTGFSWRSQSLRSSDLLLGALRVPIWRRPIYDVLTSRPGLRFFLQSSRRTRLNRALVDYAYATSHQPLAENAPYYFIAFQLFTPNILEVYRALPQPCLAIFGQDPFAGYERAGEFCDKPNWRIECLSSAGALAHWDEPRAVIALLDAHFAAK